MSLLHHLTIMRRAKGSGISSSIGQQANAAPMGSHEYPIGGSLCLESPEKFSGLDIRVPCRWYFNGQDAHCPSYRCAHSR